MADDDCLLRRQVAAHSVLMAAIAVSSLPLLAWKIFFIASASPLGVVPLR